jgi:hypothetical protein
LKVKFLFVIMLLGMSLLTLQGCSLLNGSAPKSSTVTRQKKGKRTRVPKATARARRTETASPRTSTPLTPTPPSATPTPTTRLNSELKVAQTRDLLIVLRRL